MNKACPCHHTEACNPRCTCVTPESSYGCTRCCSYGSKKHQRERAYAIARVIDIDNFGYQADNFGTPDIAGECFGVDLVQRGPDDDHISIRLCVEDDESWHRTEQFSNFWIDDLIDVLKRAKQKMKRSYFKAKDGYRFTDHPGAAGE